MIIGVDPHKASVTIEVVDEHGAIAARGRFPTDVRSYRTLLGYARCWPHRVWAVWAVEGWRCRPAAGPAAGRGRRTCHVSVIDVPAKLAARARVFDTGHDVAGRKTDAVDAHSIAAVALRTPGLRVLHAEDTDLQVLRLRVDRRDEPSAPGSRR